MTFSSSIRIAEPIVKLSANALLIWNVMSPLNTSSFSSKKLNRGSTGDLTRFVSVPSASFSVLSPISGTFTLNPNGL